MSTTATKFTVGLFLILGALLAVAMVIYVGMTGKLGQGSRYVIYFDESVQGLDKDSQVKYRGVAIGRVETIQVAPDGKLIEVVAAIDRALKPKGRLMAQLKSVGLTGIMFIELDQMSQEEADKLPVLSFSAPYPVIPSKPSDIQQIFRELNSMFRRIASIDFEGIAKKVDRDLDTLDQAIVDADIKKISGRFTSALDRLNTILETRQWTRILDTIHKTGQDVDSRVNEARHLIAHIDSVVKRVEQILAENQKVLHSAAKELRDTLRDSSVMVSSTDARIAGLYRNLLVSTQNLEKATENLNSLLETLSQDPGQAVFGEPPPPRPVSPGTIKNKE